ncbi:hypothetical protein KQY10_02890 [Leptospira interrogans]|uniref:Lipoprotein n=4 Tax=Leptospiraceae TaxID=170 RepID=A0AAP9WCY0_LEPIR|nr:hypothetical protein C4X99_05315 [Leptospira interrogans serovar Geyaweera]MBE0302043.1 hypothetical protein [Leptospira interrogans serovar Yeoncheon]MBM2890286.1 hypothetical protein [Leptospira interrogans]OOB92632.1 hypothetical protein B0191_20955 [Leptospira interrogans serovar Hardjo]QOI41743.1 hypothetical protein Lepto782_05305 [Leptospira interrogans serovar Canicola]
MKKRKRMNKLLWACAILLLATGCFTIGKVGYMSPASHDDSELSKEVLGEKCGFVVTNILNDMNSVLSNKGKSDLTNVGLKFTGSNCAQTRSIK